MNKIPAILSATLTATLAACADDPTPIGQPVTTPLVTSEPATVGTVSVFNSTDGFFVTATPATPAMAAPHSPRGASAVRAPCSSSSMA